MGILAAANLCAGFAQNAAMLFAFRSIAGLGGDTMYMPSLPFCPQTKLMMVEPPW
jgi:hypothetical protein